MSSLIQPNRTTTDVCIACWIIRVYLWFIDFCSFGIEDQTIDVYFSLNIHFPSALKSVSDDPPPFLLQINRDASAELKTTTVVTLVFSLWLHFLSQCILAWLDDKSCIERVSVTTARENFTSTSSHSSLPLSVIKSNLFTLFREWKCSGKVLKQTLNKLLFQLELKRLINQVINRKLF